MENQTKPAYRSGGRSFDRTGKEIAALDSPERVTDSQLDARIARINKWLKAKNLPDIELGKRYGYKALDSNKGSGTIATGLKSSEVLLVLIGMETIIDWLDRK